MAILLKKGDHCEIIPPNWLKVDYLKDKVKLEFDLKDDYQDLPFHYLEISTLLFQQY